MKIILTTYGETGLAAIEALKDFDVITMENEPIKHLESLIDTHKPDAVVMSSYSRIIPQRVLDKCLFINVHHGDLPRYRGRANINWAIINNRCAIGLTIHNAVSDLDAGNIYHQEMFNISNDDTCATVYNRFNEFIINNLSNIVTNVLKGYKGVPQNNDLATYTCTRTPEDGLIDWTNDAFKIDCLIRGVTKPFPGAFTYYKGKKLIIWDCGLDSKRKYVGSVPGRVGLIHSNGVDILTGHKQSLTIKKVNYDGNETSANNVIQSISDTLKGN